MPPLKIQPVDRDSVAPREPAKPFLKSRLKRLFDRPFTSVLRSATVEKPIGGGSEFHYGQDGADASEFEPSSICLTKMVQNFIEESNEKQSAAKCGRNRCNCFNANNDSSDDDLDLFGSSSDSFTSGYSGDATDLLKSLIPCPSMAERNLLADTAKIVENHINVKRKDELRKIVTQGLSSLGYDSSICKSRWEKSPSFPAGEYEYIDVLLEEDRLLIDVEFRSEFEIVRQTGAYKAILQSLPSIFVGKPDRLGQIVSIVSETAKQSLRKKGMHFPPWRKSEYMLAKWMSPYVRATVSAPSIPHEKPSVSGAEAGLVFGEDPPTSATKSSSLQEGIGGGIRDDVAVVVMTWRPTQEVEREAKIITGLASLLKEKP